MADVKSIANSIEKITLEDFSLGEVRMLNNLMMETVLKDRSFLDVWFETNAGIILGATDTEFLEDRLELLVMMYQNFKTFRDFEGSSVRLFGDIDVEKLKSYHYSNLHLANLDESGYKVRLALFSILNFLISVKLSRDDYEFSQVQKMFRWLTSSRRKGLSGQGVIYGITDRVAGLYSEVFPDDTPFKSNLGMDPKKRDKINPLEGSISLKVSDIFEDLEVVSEEDLKLSNKLELLSTDFLSKVHESTGQRKKDLVKKHIKDLMDLL